MKKYILTAILCLLSGTLSAQPAPISWSHAVQATATPDEYEVTFAARIAPPWYLYDLGPYEGGPNATSFEFADVPGLERVGETEQTAVPDRAFDPIFGMEVGHFTRLATFSQRVRTSSAVPIQWTATVTWQVCNPETNECLAPDDHDFYLTIPASVDPAVTSSPSAPSEELFVATATDSSSLWGTILEAILWGLAAFLTPCVFPMAPMTVSFFLKGSENRSRGRGLASLYGAFIVLLYTLPIAVLILATYLIGGENVTTGIFNWIATHWLPNVLFFVVFMLFAASFFGAFELRLPSKWINRADTKSDGGGLFGLFFMALTLVLVSFSCTGPIVSSVLVKSTQGAIWEPIFTMLAFSLAFALPFTILAFFPALLKNLPRSGGWLNSVKVVLGFVEIALGLKFLSVADQTYHWGLLDREIYLALWIVTFTLLGFYLLGKIKFKHDSDVKYIGIFRLTLVIAVFSFVVYLVPGMWGAPLKALSGYLPPLHTQDFVIGGATFSQTTTSESPAPVKYGDFLHLPHGLSGFFDYAEGMAHAKEVGKPVFIDITGHGCVNCREMEARVWSNPLVLSLLRDQYVIVALYVDDKTRLPESEWVTDSRGRIRKGLGQINADFALRQFGTNAQPYYVLLDNDGRPIAPPRAYNLDIEAFVDFLQTGLANYNRGMR